MKKYSSQIILVMLALILGVSLIIAFRSPGKEQSISNTTPPVSTLPEEPYQKLSSEYIAIQIKYAWAIQEQDRLRLQIDLLSQVNQQTQLDCNAKIQAKDIEYNTLLAKLASTQQQVQNTKDELATYGKQMEESYKKLKDQLSHFPPKNFSSVKEFRDWRDPLECVGDNTTASWPYDCLKLQAQAFQDGFIINFSYAGSRLMHYPTILIGTEVYIISPIDHTILLDQGNLP